MSKFTLRSRAIDPSKSMPIYLGEKRLHLANYSQLPQMPSGMPEEEESEHHLQRAISTGVAIPTPMDITIVDQEAYDRMYPQNYKIPHQLIHTKLLDPQQEGPDYDMDSEDENWLEKQSGRFELAPLEFEQLMENLEKSSGQMHIKDDPVSASVYDYWLNKRSKTQHPLIPAVKSEILPGESADHPYLAFSQPCENRYIRKNRRNKKEDETAYMKMLQLKRYMQRATAVLKMVTRREQSKKQHSNLCCEILNKDLQMLNFSGDKVKELNCAESAPTEAVRDANLPRVICDMQHMLSDHTYASFAFKQPQSDKEEESEHHLHIKLSELQPYYDMDSEDEHKQSGRFKLTPLKFEQLKENLEKSSGQMAIQDDPVRAAVYDYGLNKRSKAQHDLIPTVKTEIRAGESVNDPYLGFSQPCENRYIRKNRGNKKEDETAYMKMLQLKRNIQRATAVLKMVTRREQSKKQHSNLCCEILNKDLQMLDFSGDKVKELNCAESAPTEAVRDANLPRVICDLGSNVMGDHTYASFAFKQPQSDKEEESELSELQPYYDMDSEDEHKQSGRFKLTPLMFEQLKENLEKSSGQMPIQDDPVSAAVYDYGLNKRSAPTEAVRDAKLPRVFCDLGSNVMTDHTYTSFAIQPLEVSAQNYGGDLKFCYGIISLRHPKLRYIDFVWRHCSNGVSTVFDDVWEQFDYKFDSDYFNNLFFSFFCEFN